MSPWCRELEHQPALVVHSFVFLLQTWLLYSSWKLSGRYADAPSFSHVSSFFIWQTSRTCCFQECWETVPIHEKYFVVALFWGQDLEAVLHMFKTCCLLHLLVCPRYPWKWARGRDCYKVKKRGIGCGPCGQVDEVRLEHGPKSCRHLACPCCLSSYWLDGGLFFFSLSQLGRRARKLGQDGRAVQGAIERSLLVANITKRSIARANKRWVVWLGSVLLPATVSKQLSLFYRNAFTNHRHALILVIG